MVRSSSVAGVETEGIGMVRGPSVEGAEAELVVTGGFDLPASAVSPWCHFVFSARASCSASR